MTAERVAEAKRRTGITSDSRLIEAALANIAVADDDWEWMMAHRGTVDPDPQHLGLRSSSTTGPARQRRLLPNNSTSGPARLARVIQQNLPSPGALVPHQAEYPIVLLRLPLRRPLQVKVPRHHRVLHHAIRPRQQTNIQLAEGQHTHLLLRRVVFLVALQNHLKSLRHRRPHKRRLR